MLVASTTALAALAWGPGRVALADVLIGDFETSDSGVQQWNNPASRVADPTGDSAYVLKLDNTAQWWNRWIWANWSNGAISETNANNNQLLEFDIYFPGTLWSNGTANVHMSWEGGAGELATTDQVLTATPDTKQHVAINYSSLGPINLNTQGWFDLNLFVYPGTYTGPDPTYPQSVYIDNLKLNTALPPPPPNNGIWDPAVSGNWSVGTNWQSGVIAFGAANSATFPAPAAPQTVTVDIGVTIGALNFAGSGANGYTIAAAAGKQISLGTGPAISVNGGTHLISAPVTINDGVIANVAGGGSLTINNLMHNGYGGFTKSGDGTFSANKLTNMTFTLDGGTVNLLPGNAQAYGFIYALIMSNGATFNLNDNQVRCNGMYDDGTGAVETINVGAGATLTTAEFADYAYSGNITGAGNLVVGWQESFGGSGPASPTTAIWGGTSGGTATYTGSTLVTNGSTLRILGSLTGTSSVTVNGASRLELPSDGSYLRVIKTGPLNITDTAKVDLSDNKLITTTSAGSWTGSNYTGVTGLIASGRGTGNQWDGSTGIVTSQSAAIGTNYTSIGVAKASDVRPATATATATWAGQTITGTDTLVMYTYGGDANLDGKLNVDDYIKIDSGIAAGLTGWSNGDFNYDGKINIDDYTTVIDANIGNQSGVFSTAAGVSSGGGSGVAAVPEPAAALTVISLATTVGAMRRRGRGKRACSL
jgi:hypothetical protein